MTHNCVDEQLKSNALELRALLNLIFKVGHQAMEQRLASYDAEVSRLQFGIMMMLSHHEDQTITELSRTLGVDPSTLVPSVDALERKGLVVRGRDPKDRRRIPLTLTAEGREMGHQVRGMGEDDPLVTGLRQIGPEATQQLLTLICRLIHNMPDCTRMLGGARSRLSAYGAKEEYLVCKQQDE
jgi:DNA-binding MarR family transcriptional regulator